VAIMESPLDPEASEAAGYTFSRTTQVAPGYA
jgi:hypothetical protein